MEKPEIKIEYSQTTNTYSLLVDNKLALHTVNKTLINHFYELLGSDNWPVGVPRQIPITPSKSVTDKKNTR